VLSYLRIAAFATIEELSISFDDGLTVITGETGAGKSLLVDALSFVSGQKLRGLSIRPGCEEGIVEALFVPPVSLPDGFSDLISEGDDIVIRRVVSSNGRIRQTINGHTVALSQLQTLVPYLFDLVGQGENVRIAQTETHREYLDLYAQTTHLAETFERLRRDIMARKKDRENLRERFEKSRQEQEQKLQIREDADLLSGGELEYEDLSRTLSAQLNLQELITLTARSYNAMYEEEQSVLSSLGRISSDIDRILSLDKSLLPVQESLSGAIEILKDTAHELLLYQESLEIDPEVLASIETRFNLYRRLAQKYHVRPEDLVGFLQSAGGLADDSLEKELQEIDGIIREREEKLRQTGQILTEKRREKSGPFSREIVKQLQLLRIDRPKFTVAFVPYESDLGGPYGMERSEFLFSANPGMPEKSLGQIASGGEISRVLLAIKSVLSDRDIIPTLVFDEIDSGIGGEVGEVLGDLLKEIGKRRQVIAITHLHQVARKGDHHLLVRKTAEDDRTRSDISIISGEDRVREIARMLGGEHISPSTLTIARDLLK